MMVEGALMAQNAEATSVAGRALWELVLTSARGLHSKMAPIGLFPSTLVDFLLLALLAALDEPLTRLFYRFYMVVVRALLRPGKVDRPVDAADAQALSPTAVYMPATYEESLFFEFAGSIRVLCVALLAIFAARMAVAALVRVGVSALPDPIDFGRKATVCTLYVIAARALTRVERAFVARAAEQKGFFGRVEGTRVLRLTRLIDAIIAAATALALAEAVGVKLRTVLAIGGAGSLALGLAARELAENAVAGAVIVAQRLFAPGEAISTDDGKVRGVVEHVGWLSTRVRQRDTTILNVPNAALSRRLITNLSRLEARQMHTSFLLRPRDLQRVDVVVCALRRELRVLAPRRLRVHFAGVSQRGQPIIEFDVLLLATGLDDFLDARQVFLLTACRTLIDVGAQFSTVPDLLAPNTVED